MVEPGQHVSGGRDLAPLRHRRAVYHDDRQPKRARGCDFGIGAAAAGIFRHDDVDPVLLHQGPVVGFGKWATRDNHLCVGQWQRGLGRIHQPQQIKMLRVWARNRPDACAPPPASPAAGARSSAATAPAISATCCHLSCGSGSHLWDGSGRSSAPRPAQRPRPHCGSSARRTDGLHRPDG